MKRDPELALNDFYEACRNAEVVEKRPLWASIGWAMCGPAAVFLMLLICASLPDQKPSTGLSKGLLHQQAMQAGILDIPFDYRRSQLTRNQTCVA